MINANQLIDLIIKPSLLDLVMYSDKAVQILVFTCALESNGGTYLKDSNGKGLGIYRMKPDTYTDIWQNYINKNQNLLLSLAINFEIGRIPSEDRLVYDLRFATAMARIHYKRILDPLPPSDDPVSMWYYYQRFYNSSDDICPMEKAINKYYSFVKGE